MVMPLELIGVLLTQPIQGKATFCIMSHSSNQDSQRVRIWSDKSHNGAIFFNYVLTQEKSWSIKSGSITKFKYKIIVADEHLTSDRIKKLLEELP